MSEEAPCKYCGHWDVPDDEKTYCLKHYRRTFPDKACDLCELEKENQRLRELVKQEAEFCLASGDSDRGHELNNALGE